MKVHKEVIGLLKESVDEYPVAEMILSGLPVKAKIMNFASGARHLEGKIIVEVAAPEPAFNGPFSNNFTFTVEDGSQASMHIAHVAALSPLELLAMQIG